MKRILILTTGGTIASRESKQGLIPAMGAEDLLSFIPEVSDLCQVHTVEVCKMDSTDMTVSQWVALACKIQEQYDAYDGFLICHGTDTMAYTAAALSYMIQDSPKPIVLTGAQKPISFQSTDAVMNLKDSFLYLLEPDSCGVQIVFGGKVICGTRAKKVNTLSYQAFSSINFPYLAVIQHDQVIRYVPVRPAAQVHFFTRWNERIFLLKLTPYSTGEMIEEIYRLYDGIIIESFGTGGIPKRLTDVFIRCQQQYPEQEKLLVLATQVMSEGSNISVYEVGRRLEGRLHFLEAKDMNLEAVAAKLMWILGMRPESFAAAEHLFYRTVYFDILAK